MAAAMRVRVVADDEPCRSCRTVILGTPEAPVPGWYDNGFLYCGLCGDAIHRHKTFYKRNG